jgi:hypothetical protein
MPLGGRDAVGGGATRLGAGRSRVRSQTGERYISLLHNVQPGAGAHSASYVIHTGVLTWG